MTDFHAMSGPQLAAEFNRMAAEQGLKPVKKFRTLAEGIKRCEKIAKPQSLLDAVMAGKISTADALTRVSGRLEKELKKSKQKAAKTRFGEGVKIAVVEKTSRRPGSKAAGIYSEMVDWMTLHPNSDLATLISETGYTRGYYQADIEAGRIKRKE